MDNHIDLVTLRKQMHVHFSKDELRILCADLGIKFDDIEGGTLEITCLNLTSYCQRRGLLSQLIQALRHARPLVRWGESGDTFAVPPTLSPSRSDPDPPPAPPVRPSIGIITALPKEYAAVKAMLERPYEDTLPGQGSGRRVLIGEIPAQGGNHSIVVSLAAMGNNSAAIRATQLLHAFPRLPVLMVGIAGGVPNPADVSEHVRLGDIVVSDERGVIQYDFDKESADLIEHRHYPRPPSAMLLEAVKLLEAAEFEGHCPWIAHIQRIGEKLDIQRPAASADVLFSPNDPPRKLRHPLEKRQNKRCRPRVFRGPIASANKLLKNPVKRDALRDRFGVKAIEMEASGVADATWNYEVGYLVIRGICDYCDEHKNDLWQEYAAIAAAGYARALIESMPVRNAGNL